MDNMAFSRIWSITVRYHEDRCENDRVRLAGATIAIFVGVMRARDVFSQSILANHSPLLTHFCPLL